MFVIWSHETGFIMSHQPPSPTVNSAVSAVRPEKRFSSRMGAYPAMANMTGSHRAVLSPKLVMVVGPIRWKPCCAFTVQALVQPERWRDEDAL